MASSTGSGTTPSTTGSSTTTPATTGSATTTPSTTGSSGTFVSLDFQETPADFSFGQSVTLQSQSLRFETTTANYGNGFLKSNFAVPGDHWGRLWMKLDSSSLTANLGHWVAVAGGAGSNQVRMMDINSNEAGKVVFQLGWQDDSFQKVTSWSNKYDLSSEWTCYEWHMDPNAQTFDFYVSGTPVVWDSPQNIGSGVPAGRDLPQTLDWIGFGVESFGGAATTIGGYFDNIVVSATRVGCGSAPGNVDTTTSTTQSSTSTTSLISTSTSTITTTTQASCGYIPTKCGKAVNKNFDQILNKNFGKFKQITGVTQEEATLDDMTLYFYCKRKAASKCVDDGLELPCTCSNPPCVCPEDRTTTTSTAPSTTSSTTTTTTGPSTSTSTTGSSEKCALSACGCGLNGQAWCNESNAWLATAWCHGASGNCQNCGGVWCAGNAGTANRRLLKTQ